MNLIMPSLDKTLVSFKKDIEKGFKEIFMTYMKLAQIIIMILLYLSKNFN